MISTLPTAIPAPDRVARDELGRLVAASWGTAPDNHAGRYGRWLVAVDGSEGSLRAASMAARLIAAEPSAGGSTWSTSIPGWSRKLPRWNCSGAGGTRAAAARSLMDEAGIAWRLHVRMGEAAEEIVALAQELGSQGIAIGSHGLTATESLFLGSVAYKIVHLGKVPVLIVR